MALGGVNYYYIKNAQGDVVRICDESGNIVITYNCDAWGNLVNFSGSVVLLLANPFRYRGYYYDLETGFYYLNSRYYDPAVGRFINADGYVSTGQDLTSCNMFAYCGNNPVNRTDPSGHSWVAIPSGSSWITIQSIASEIARAAASMAPAYTVSGVAVVADGPLPFGDMAGVAIAAGATAVAVGVGVYNGMKTKTEAPAVPIWKNKSREPYAKTKG